MMGLFSKDKGETINWKILETEAQLTYLEQQQCDIIQGYYFSKPLPAQKMATFLKLNL